MITLPRINNAAAFRTNRPLMDEEIRRVAPSIFAEAAHESRSNRYTYIPTIEVLNGLRKEGFAPFMVCQTRVRDSNKIEHTKHMIRLRHANQIESAEANEIILLNSHDGTSSYQMMGGVFRLVCSNGMVATNTVNEIKVRHQGDIVGQVIDGAYTILNDFHLIDDKRDAMKSTILNDEERGIFARSALALKYDEEIEKAPIRSEQLLRSYRTEDQRNDLWTTFNRVQENVIRGGVYGRTANGHRTRTRPVTGIDQNIKLNKALWILAEEMRRLKA